MTSLDELLKDTFDDDALAVGHDHLMADRVRTRAGHRIRRTRLHISLAAAALLVVAGVIGAALIPSPAGEFVPGTEAPPAPADVVPDRSAGTTSYDQFLDELARWAGLGTPPPVPNARTLDDSLEHVDRVASCIADAGFPGDSHSFESEAEFARFTLAVYTCNATYRLDDRFYEPRTDSQIRFIRDFWVSTSIPCLARTGFVIPEPPSAQVLIDTWTDIDGYSVEGELSKQAGEYAFRDAIRACPVMPALADIVEHEGS